MSKHTPGPWQIDDGGTDAFAIATEDGLCLCCLSEDPAAGTGLLGRETDAANARLIAAAPRMAEALKFQYQALVELCEEWGMGLPGQVHGCLANMRDDARGALAAATGEEGEVAFPATAEGELQRQAAFAAARARQEEDRDRCGDPTE